MYNFAERCEAGTEITLVDEGGNVIVSYIPDKEYQSVVISVPELVKDGIYTIASGNQNEEITLSNIVTSNATQGTGFPGGRGKR
ncbi:MAG: hypothetical protein GX913_05400, partial [Clostridiales bacterium]|nr:hypothetical protein [Clostridiales bacterium]